MKHNAETGLFVADLPLAPLTLDLMTLPQVLSGDRYVKNTPMSGKQEIMGRGLNCAVTITLDGQQVLGTCEDAVGSPTHRG